MSGSEENAITMTMVTMMVMVKTILKGIAGIMMVTYENRAGGPNRRLSMAGSLFSLSLSVVEEPSKWIQVKPQQQKVHSAVLLKRTFHVI